MKILAIDDDKVALELLKTCLLSAGYSDIETALSAAEAMKKIDKAKTPYDSILLDIEMPKKDGIETCADIRALPAYKHTPIIMVTRKRESNSIKRAFAKGATDYITKPFEVFEVISRIKLADRLVQERRAAMDSYLALQTASGSQSTHRALEIASNFNSFQTSCNNVLLTKTFENYIDKMTRADGVELNILALKIANISQIFAELPAEDFNLFLEHFVKVVLDYTGSGEVFLSQVGNGTFVCAANNKKFKPPLAFERDIIELLRRQDIMRNRFANIPVELLVGDALTLPANPRPKFKRALKVCLARLSNRESQVYKQLTSV